MSGDDAAAGRAQRFHDRRLIAVSSSGVFHGFLDWYGLTRSAFFITRKLAPINDKETSKKGHNTIPKKLNTMAI
jgi:hypothetical protein